MSQKIEVLHQPMPRNEKKKTLDAFAQCVQTKKNLENVNWCHSGVCTVNLEDIQQRDLVPNTWLTSNI